jgi:ubiquinone/menaquinone biosynthesis C-methylase UbiE/DNA-binding transcriptional ArsR family regulator
VRLTGSDPLLDRACSQIYHYIRIYGLNTPAILDDLSALADITRDRLLLLVESQELTVSELCAVLQLPQSTISRHLKALADGGWVTSRAEGTSRLYALAKTSLAPDSRRLWLLVRDQIVDSAAAAEDHRRLQAVLAARRSRSQEFFSSAAGQWDHLRTELFGSSFHFQALAGLLDPDWVVGDLGCGTGPVTAALAPYVSRVVAIDNSPAMLGAARKRLAGADNVEFRRGDLEALPVSDGELSAATLTLVLPYLSTPARVFQEVGRVLEPGGRVLVTDLVAHARESYRQQLGHQWLGFADTQIVEWLENAGFARVRVHMLPASRDTKGPGLFVATGQKPFTK